MANYRFAVLSLQTTKRKKGKKKKYTHTFSAGVLLSNDNGSATGVTVQGKCFAINLPGRERGWVCKIEGKTYGLDKEFLVPDSVRFSSETTL